MSSVIVTHSGAVFDLLNPVPESVHLSDIAYSLSRMARYNGHTKYKVPYSVAQHSVYTASQVEPPIRVAALLHDAHEAYLGDLARPIKGLFPGWTELERRVQAVIHARFGLPWPLDGDVEAAIKYADNQALATEWRDLMPPFDISGQLDGAKATPDPIVPVPAEAAEQLFIEHYVLAREKVA